MHSSLTDRLKKFPFLTFCRYSTFSSITSTLTNLKFSTKAKITYIFIKMLTFLENYFCPKSIYHVLKKQWEARLSMSAQCLQIPGLSNFPPSLLHPSVILQARVEATLSGMSSPSSRDIDIKTKE